MSRDLEVSAFIQEGMKEIHTRDEPCLAGNLSSVIDGRRRTPVPIEAAQAEAIRDEGRVNEAKTVGGAGEGVAGDIVVPVDSEGDALVPTKRAKVAETRTVVEKCVLEPVIIEERADDMTGVTDSRRRTRSGY